MDYYFRNFGAHEMSLHIIRTKQMDKRKIYLHKASLAVIGQTKLASGFATRLIGSAWLTAFLSGKIGLDTGEEIINAMALRNVVALEYSRPSHGLEEPKNVMSIEIPLCVLDNLLALQRLACSKFNTRIRLSSFVNAILMHCWCSHTGRYSMSPIIGAWETVPATSYSPTPSKEKWYLSWLDSEGQWQMETDVAILTPRMLPRKSNSNNRKKVAKSNVAEVRAVKVQRDYSSKGRER